MQIQLIPRRSRSLLFGVSTKKIESVICHLRLKLLHVEFLLKLVGSTVLWFKMFYMGPRTSHCFFFHSVKVNFSKYSIQSNPVYLVSIPPRLCLPIELLSSHKYAQPMNDMIKSPLTNRVDSRERKIVPTNLLKTGNTLYFLFA